MQRKAEYIVYIEETLCKTLNVRARSEEEAMAKVAKDYKDGKIVLDASNYVTTQISTPNTDWTEV
jgi:hypothetical protein